MIKNAREFRISRAQVRRFEEAAAQLSARKKSKKGVHPVLVKAQRKAIESQLQSLRKELADYDEIRRHGHKGIDVRQIEDVPSVLIKARIAAGLTQRELAKRLGIKEQQIQRYEATQYSSASFARILEVARALKY
jgi:ribosome-binding protein aMBF1 (putative translation factor)